MMKRDALLLLLLLWGIPGALAQESYAVREVETFVSPDSSFPALRGFLEGTGESLYLHLYTLESPSIARWLLEAEGRGVEVVLCLEGSPVGGVSEEAEALLALLIQGGVEARYCRTPGLRFHHAKYAVSDNRTLLITTENFGSTGFPEEGTAGNRGWGIILRDEALSTFFADLFLRDLEGPERVSLSTIGGFPQERPREEYSPRFKRMRYRGHFRAVPLVAPENALHRVLGLLKEANRSLYVEQLYIYTFWGPRKTGSVEETPNLLLEEAIQAARRGVSVKILLDSTWYNIEWEDPVSNLHTVRYINELAEREGLDLEARLADAEGLGVEKIHTKGIVVDDRAVLISSVNWNEHSPTKNREVGVIFYGEPAEYYAQVFLCDWEGGCLSREEKVLILLTLLPLTAMGFWWWKRRPSRRKERRRRSVSGPIGRIQRER
jgi:phosphatidylserine/phosphatidylglycerophosphate/cardiolipin synthase-like enzyme